MIKERVTGVGSEMLDPSFILSYHSDPRLMRAAEIALKTRLFKPEEWDEIVEDSMYRYVDIRGD